MTTSLTTQKPANKQDPHSQADEGLEDEFKPLTQEQAQAWRLSQPTASPWLVLLWQAGAGVVFATACAAYTSVWSTLWSALYGVLSVLLPGVMFVRAWLRQAQRAKFGGFKELMVWELAKIGLTVSMLLSAPRLVSDLSWPILLASFVVTMKASWLAIWCLAKRR